MGAGNSPDKPGKTRERMIPRLNRQTAGSLVACVRCGICAHSCHYALANPEDPTFTPAYKGEQIRKFFRRSLNWTGFTFPRRIRAKDPGAEEDLLKLKDLVFGKCSSCRRCSLSCPMGVDFASLNRMARGFLTAAGLAPEGIAAVSKDQWELGNQMGIRKEDYLQTLEWLSDELENEMRDPAARIPVDKAGAEVVYAINPREIKYDPRTISDAARIFYAAGENWTMASTGWDMTNFGLFSGDDELSATMVRRLYEKVLELRGKKLVISECGHGYRSSRCEGPNWVKMNLPFVIESSIQTTLRYLREGRFKVDRTRNTIPLTYHDPCDSARSCGLIEEPRELLNLVTADFREMYPNRAENFCCGGGGGAMSMSEYTPLRLKSALIKVNQLKATQTKIVVTSCHNCVDALADLIRHYKLGMQVTQIVNLVARAIILSPKRVASQKVPITSEAPILKGYKILVAEDEPDISLFISTVLEDRGAKVLQAYDGDQAVELALLERPDLITLDLSMPGRNGGYVYEQLKKNPELSSVRVCIITGNPELRRLIYDRPVPPPEGYLDKPIDEGVLLRNVRKILELPYGASQGTDSSN